MHRLKTFQKKTGTFVLFTALNCAAGIAFAQTPPPPIAPPPTVPTVPTEPTPTTPTPPSAAKPEAPQAVDKIEVTGKVNATEERRNSSAAKIIITREDIQQYGDSNISEVMRRLPGVTQGGRPGRGGPIAMRGMGGGFTQILIDGQRIPPGFSLDQLTPEQVERIEILRAPTAETGARAIAGTINIVLREPIRKTDNDYQIGVTEENGVYPARASFTRNDKFGDKGTWSITVNGDLGHLRNESDYVTRFFNRDTRAKLVEQFGDSESDNQTKSVFVNARMQWALGAGEQFGVMLFTGANAPNNTWHQNLTQTLGTRPEPYAVRDGAFLGHFSPSRINVNLNKRLDAETRYELRGGIGAFRGEAFLKTQDFDRAGVATLLSSTDTISRDRSWNLSGKLMRNVGEGKHSLTAGAEIESVDRDQTSITLNNGVQQLADLGEEFNAGSRRIALYLQDEWEISSKWGANLGVRYETINTTSKSSENDVKNVSKVLTPLGHLVYRFDPPSREQIRLSLTQSYRPPSTDQVLARPFLNTQYPAPGANTIVNADRAGNPTLKPERANGIDLAYEQYFKSGGVFSVNLFHRQITDLIRNVTALESVSWATSPRYVSRPQNFSEAFSQGVEFDTKFSLTEIVEGAIPVNFRFNASLLRSKVKDVIGPNNRINDQPKFISNIGADYRFRGTPVSVGGNMAWTPGFTTQTTNLAENSVNLKRVGDLYALWTVDTQTKVRLTASNFSPSDTVTESITLTDFEQISTLSNAKNYRNVTLRLEMRF